MTNYGLYFEWDKKARNNEDLFCIWRAVARNDQMGQWEISGLMGGSCRSKDWGRS